MAGMESGTALKLVVATLLVTLLRVGIGLNLKFAALGDLDGRLGLVAGARGNILDLLNDFVALEHFAKNDVFAIEPAAQV